MREHPGTALWVGGKLELPRPDIVRTKVVGPLRDQSSWWDRLAYLWATFTSSLFYGPLPGFIWDGWAPLSICPTIYKGIAVAALQGRVGPYYSPRAVYAPIEL